MKNEFKKLAENMNEHTYIKTYALENAIVFDKYVFITLKIARYRNLIQHGNDAPDRRGEIYIKLFS